MELLKHGDATAIVHGMFSSSLCLVMAPLRDEASMAIEAGTFVQVHAAAPEQPACRGDRRQIRAHAPAL